MSNEDMANILQILRGNLSDFASIPDRTHQGVLNHLVLTKLMRGAFIDHPAATVNGTVVIDPSRAYYWGISLGGVLVLGANAFNTAGYYPASVRLMARILDRHVLRFAGIDRRGRQPRH